MDFKIIAVDFDGTLCENKWPEIGKPNEALIAYLKEQKKAGVKLILWTCRVGEILKNAVDWSVEQGIIFDAVNENLPEVIDSMNGDTRKIFADEYIDDKNVSVKSCRRKSDMQSWAEREIEIACERERKESGNKYEWDYGCACYESALKAYKSLLEDFHSGFSIGMTTNILHRLIEVKPLTPIEDTEDIWNHIADVSGLEGEVVNYQCKRMSSLFKDIYPDGSVKYRDIDRFYCVNKDSNVSYRSGLVTKVMDELFPIKMPYFPESMKTKVVCEEFLTDRKNGDYDTVGILYAIRPDGTRVELNQYFKEAEHDFVDISKEEYEERRVMYQELLKERNGDEPK